MTTGATESKDEIGELQHQRTEQRSKVREEQDQLIEIDRELLRKIIKRRVPQAAQLIFKVEKRSTEWTGHWLALVGVLDAQRQPLSWKPHLTRIDRQLLEQIQFDLTDCYAIPRNETQLILDL